jgi:peptidoglycan/LPS O-acetylase OafA/YrhL
MQRGERLDHIHGLRGVAALAVVIQHSTQFIQMAGLPHYHLLLDYINAGRFGVILFFLISGLVIPFSFRGETPMRHFVVSRFFRLYPAYLLSIPVLSIIAVFEYGQDLGLARLLANVTMMQGFLGEPDIGPGYWTLKFEVLFYFLTALLFWRRMLDDAALNGIFVLVFLAVAIQPIVVGLLFGEPGFIRTDPYMVAMFFLGMLLRRRFVDDCRIARAWLYAMVPAAILTGVAISGFIYPSPDNGNVFLRPLPLTMGMVLPIIVIVLVLRLKPTVPKWAMYLGTISYSLYLFQDIGLIYLRYVLPPANWPIVYVVAVVALSLGIASLVNRYLEQPMISLGKRFSELKRVAPAIAFH